MLRKSLQRDLLVDLLRFRTVSYLKAQKTAVEAIMNGVPSFTSPHSPASPVSLPLYNLDSIEDPHMPDREQWLYSLLGAQFTKSEMQSGYAYSFLQDEK